MADFGKKSPVQVRPKIGRLPASRRTSEPFRPLLFIREARGLGVAEVAAAAGLSVENLERIEKHGNLLEIPPVILAKVAKALGVESSAADELLGLIPPPAPDPDMPAFVGPIIRLPPSARLPGDVRDWCVHIEWV